MQDRNSLNNFRKIDIQPSDLHEHQCYIETDNLSAIEYVGL